MSTYVLMRVLESAPRRYDLGIRLLTLGAVQRAYERLLAPVIRPDMRVLDIGTGTGALAVRAAQLGASVKAIDPNSGMLAVAAERIRRLGLADRIELCEMGVGELGREPAAGYDAVCAGLVFSELSPDERRYALEQIQRILRPGGWLLLADETAPAGRLALLAHRILRSPLVALAYVLTQQTTHPVQGLEDALRGAGFEVRSVRRSACKTLVEIAAQKPRARDAASGR